MYRMNRSTGVLLVCASWLSTCAQSSRTLFTEAAHSPQATSSSPSQVHVVTLLLSQRRVLLGHPATVILQHQPGSSPAFVQVLQEKAGHQFFQNEAPDFVSRHIITGDISDDGTSRVLHSSATQDTYQIIPLQPGPLELRVVATFPDRAMMFEHGVLDVIPTSQDLIYFRLSDGPYASIVLTGEPSKEALWFFPSVQYSTLKYPIRLIDSTAIQLRVEQPTNAAGERILQVDANGKVHGLHTGRAIVIGTFAGVESRVVVTVYTHAAAPAGYPLSKP